MKQPKVFPGCFLLAIVKCKEKLGKKKKKGNFKKETELADWENFQSFMMAEDAKINGSQAKIHVQGIKVRWSKYNIVHHLYVSS